MADSVYQETILVESAISGDADAFGELYSLYLDAIYRYVYLRVGDCGDAEDLTEQVFLKAWKALPSYQQYGNPFTSWLYRIAHNVVADHYRRRRPVTTWLPQDSYHTDEPTALEQVIEAEETAALANAITRLPEEQQQVIILRFVEGLSHAEVAQIIDKSEGACRVIQHRGLAALSQLLAEAQNV